MTTAEPLVRAPRLRILRSAIAGAAVLFLLFVACWIGTAFSGLTVSHMFISLFTAQAVGSTAALIEGSAWSLVFGAATGALVAIFHNLFNVGRR